MEGPCALCGSERNLRVEDVADADGWVELVVCGRCSEAPEPPGGAMSGEASDVAF